jgi:hypothetical protein
MPFVTMVIAVVLSIGACRDKTPETLVSVPRTPVIEPDYAGVVVQPNIAPLNFMIREPGETYRATIHSDTGPGIEVVSRTGAIMIAQDKWKGLLTHNIGKALCIDVDSITGATTKLENTEAYRAGQTSVQ